MRVIDLSGAWRLQHPDLRAIYKLTDAGRHALSAEADRQAANARVAADRLRAWKATADRAVKPRPGKPAALGGTA